MSIALASAVRPLCCGDPLRRLVAKCFCLQGAEAISKVFKDKNFGVGCKGGVEVVAHSLRDTLARLKGQKGMALLKIDFRNAFNEISRDFFLKAACSLFPELSAWSGWCYSSPSILLYDHLEIIESLCGVQQGDPLGPLYFCCGIMPLVEELQALDPEYNKWYMDDGGIVAPVEVLSKVWEILRTKGPPVGLHLNPAKCEWTWLDPACMDPCPLLVPGQSSSPVPLVPWEEVQMLGVPLGGDAFTADFVEKKLLGRLSSTVEKLVAFEDTQAAFYLLRVSFSIVRAVHFMRTTELFKWLRQAVMFDSLVREAAEHILGLTLPGRRMGQAALTPRLGGIGLRRTVEHADGAFSASWHEAKTQAGEAWQRPGTVRDAYVPQKEASFLFDQKQHLFLIDTAPDDREAQRLRRLAQPHAGAWMAPRPFSARASSVSQSPTDWALPSFPPIPPARSARKLLILSAITPLAAQRLGTSS